MRYGTLPAELLWLARRDPHQIPLLRSAFYTPYVPHFMWHLEGGKS